MQTIITISPAIQDYGTTFLKRWNVSWIPPEEKTPYQSKETNDKKPEIQNGFWSNIKGERLKEATYGEKVKFTVNTKDIDDGTVLNFTLYDYDGNYNPDDELSRSFSVKVKNNVAKLEFIPDVKWEESAKYEIDKIVEAYFKIETEIEGKKITTQLPKKEGEYLKMYGNPEIITVLIELPHTDYEDKLNSKGLAGHSAMMIGTEFYDFGPQPGDPFLSDGRPWWDIMSKNGNLKRADIVAILGNLKERKSWNIVGEVYLIDIEISPKEKIKIEKWWIEKYAIPGNYSIIPLLGKQCTTNVILSLSECTDTFNYFSMPSMAQTPKGLFHLLTTSSKHTYGKNRKKQLSVTKKYNQI